VFELHWPYLQIAAPVHFVPMFGYGSGQVPDVGMPSQLHLGLEDGAQ